MSRVMNLPNRLTIGIVAIALLAIAAAATTFATQPSHALTPPAPTGQVADTAVDAPGAVDTGTADVRVGSQTGIDKPGTEVASAEVATAEVAGAEAKTASAPETDTIQSGAGSQTQTGDQTTADVAGAASN